MQLNFYEKFVIIIYIVSVLGIIVGGFLSTDAKNTKNKAKGKIALMISIAAIVIASVVQAILWSNTQLG